MTLQEFLTSKVLEIKNREPNKGDFFLDQNHHQWYFDGSVWNDLGLNSIQNYAQGYGVLISDGIISVNPNIVALKSDVLDSKITVNNNEDIKTIEFTGADVSVDSEDNSKVVVDLSGFLSSDTEFATVATTGSYNDLTNKPAPYTLPVSTPNTLGGVKVDGITVIADAEGNISVPSATGVTKGVVKLSTSYLGNSSELVPTEAAIRAAFVEVKTRSFCYVSYADDENGTNWSTNPYKGNAVSGQALKTSDFRKYRAEIVVEHEIERALTASDFAGCVWVKYVGDDVYLYMGYASDDQGSNFTTTPSRAVKYAAFLISYTEIANANLEQAFASANVTWVKYIGDNSYSYIAYASDNQGSNWSLTPTYSLKYRAELISDALIPNPSSSDFAGCTWMKYLGDDAYIYAAYATDSQGSNFSTTPDFTKKYISVLVTYTELQNPTLSDFSGCAWTRYIGVDTYTYAAYASDNQGSNFSTTPSWDLKYRAEIHVNNPIATLTSTDFTGVTWVKYIGNNAYLYVAYADDASGTGFSNSPSFSKKYIATLVTYEPISGSPTSTDFAGCTWTRYIGIDTYTYVAYASNSSGANFNLVPSDSLKYRAEIHSNTQIQNVSSSDFATANWIKYLGDDAYPRYAYAEDENGNGFSLIPDFSRKYIAQTVLYTDRTATSSDFTNATWVKYIGNNCYVYFAYASDASGTGFSTTPSNGLKYINYITSYVPLDTFTLAMFNQRTWTRYIGIDTYTYVAYASDALGTDWNTTPSLSLKYRAEIHVDAPIASLSSSDFASATWVKYIGIDTYTYVGYASSSTGADFSLTPSASLVYRKEIHSEILLNPPISTDFGTTGWIQIIPQISIGTVVSGSEAVVTNVGTGLNPVLNITLPRGQDGIGITPQGEYDNTITYVLNDVVRFGKYLWRCKVSTSLGVEPPSTAGVTSNSNWDVWLEDGQTPTISIGTVSIAPGNTPTVTNSGSSTSMVLDFGLVPGQAATVSVGTVSTGNPGSNVVVTNSGTSYAAVLDITIPRGDNGYYFTPSVDSNGDISWTNNGGLSNPSTVNIRGPQGVSYYLYVAYASDAAGSDWSTTPSNSLPYRAEIVLNESKTVTASDFTGARWVKYIGNSAYEIWLANGHTGTQGDFLDWLRMQSASIDFNDSDLVSGKLMIQSSNAVVAIVDNDGYQWQLPQRTVRYVSGNNIEIDMTGIMAMAGITSLTGTWKVMLAGGLTS